MNTERRTITLPVAFRGESRPVTFALFRGAAYGLGTGWNRSAFLARIGRGTKTHPVMVQAYRFASVEDAHRQGFRADDRSTRQLVEVEGELWGARLEGMVLNRQATVVAWADEAPTSAHIMERR